MTNQSAALLCVVAIVAAVALFADFPVARARRTAVVLLALGVALTLLPLVAVFLVVRLAWGLATDLDELLGDAFDRWVA